MTSHRVLTRWTGFCASCPEERPLLLVSYAMPETHFIEIMRGICLRGSTVAELWPDFLFLALAPCILLFLAARRLRASLLEE